MLNGLHENMGDYLISQNGKYAWGTTSKETQMLAKGKDRTNNMCETIFAYFDYLYGRHPNFLVSTVAGVTIAKKNKIFDDGGSWTRLTDKMRQALMRMITNNYKDIMEANTKEEEAQKQHNVMRRAFKRTAALTTADDKYDKAQKLFKRGLTCLEELTKLCSDENGNICEQANIVGKQRDALKHNIRVAVHAYGWENWSKPFSKKGDTSVGKVPDLYAFVKRVMTEDENKTIPNKCFVKQPSRKVQRVLGEKTLQRVRQEADMDREDRTDIMQRYANKNQAAEGNGLPCDEASTPAQYTVGTLPPQPEPEVRQSMLMDKLQPGTQITYRWVDADGGWDIGSFYRVAVANDPEAHLCAADQPEAGYLLFWYSDSKLHAHELAKLEEDENKTSNHGWHFGNDAGELNKKIPSLNHEN